MKRKIVLSDGRIRHVNSLLKSRMGKFILSLPSPMKRDMQEYVRSSHRAHVRQRDSSAIRKGRPYWVLLPLWIEQKFCSWTKDHSSTERQFIHDVLWAQYCIFQQVTIHDDLLDRQQSNPALIFAANQFQFEADSVLSKYFWHASWFWKVYRTLLSETNRAIIDVRSLQNSKIPEPEDILAQHAKVYAILKVGSAAVCSKMRKIRYFPMVSRFADEMAKTSQALDDLTDIEEDLGRGEFNYASAYILQSQGNRMPARKQALKRIHQAFLVGDAIPQFFQQLRGHLRSARRMLQPLEIDAAIEYFQRYEAVLEAMEEYFHRRRIRLFLGDLALLSK